MRTALVFLFTAAIAGSAHAQTPQPQPRAVDAMRRTAAVRLQLQLAEMSALQFAQTAVGANHLKADRVSFEQDTLRLQGNVVISFMNGVVATADDAVIENGAIRLGGNAVVRIPPK